MFFNTDFLTDGEIRLNLTRTAEADPVKGWVPAYYFDICDLQGTPMGKCDLRIGHNEKLYFGGNIGYGVDEAFRGHRYAAKACLLLFRLAAMHDLGYVIITCREDNIASYKTCESLGGELLAVADVPEDSDMRAQGVERVRIYRFEV